MDAVFVGAGAVASQYGAALPDSSLELAAVCDTDEDRARAFGARHDAPAFTDLGTALATVDAPLAVNLTAHGEHASVTRQCLDAGRHVFSEKPIAMDPVAARDLLDAAVARDRGLACAPLTPRYPAQRLAGRALADGRLGPVRLGYAHAHVGRVTEWHDRPASFLAAGPLYDGGVYPLTLLVAWFGPVVMVRTADALDVWPDREGLTPAAPAHVEATLAFASGPTVRLTASLYAPHRSREFYGLELHGDDGSLYLRDAGTLHAERDSVAFGRQGRAYTPMPPQSPGRSRTLLDGVEAFAAAIEDDRPPLTTARRAAHVVAVCDAIERATDGREPVDVDGLSVTAAPVAPPTIRPHAERGVADGEGDAALRLPPVGFGCSRYRDGDYVDRAESIAVALDAGYRLLDVAELYGNEHRVGELLAAPGSPDRDGVFVFGKVWNTNHDHVLEACTGSLAELGLDAFDCYALHWPEAWAYRGPLRRLDEQPIDRQERLTFPEEGSRQAGLSLAASWRNLEDVAERGLARTLGVCNVSLSQLETVLDAGSRRPAVVQVERHPYRPRSDLVSFCHDRGIRVIAHSPLSAPGLLSDPVVAAIATERGLPPASVVLAWNVTRGVVPIPSSNSVDHVVDNLAAAAERLSPADCDRLDALRDPDFER